MVRQPAERHWSISEQDPGFLFNLIYLQMCLRVLGNLPENLWPRQMDHPLNHSFPESSPHNRKGTQTTFSRVIHQPHGLHCGLTDTQRPCICNFVSYACDTHKCGENAEYYSAESWTGNISHGTTPACVCLELRKFQTAFITKKIFALFGAPP